MGLLTKEQLKEKFSNTYEFLECYKEDKTSLHNFMHYTYKRFKLCSSLRTRDIHRSVDKLLDFISKDKASDYDVFKHLRERQLMYTDSKVIDEKHLREYEAEQYGYTITKKMEELGEMFKKNNIKTVEHVLDIGTERLEFLDAISSTLHVKHDQVRGINIDTGFCHYDEAFKKNSDDPRFKMYDGKVIPFADRTFDLITLYSVIHHITNENFKDVAKEIARVTKHGGFLYFKDVDLKTKTYQILFRIQHYLFEGVMLPGDFSYMNWDVTLDGTIQSLIAAGFEQVDTKVVNNFNRSYYALLRIPPVVATETTTTTVSDEQPASSKRPLEDKDEPDAKKPKLDK